MHIDNFVIFRLIKKVIKKNMFEQLKIKVILVFIELKSMKDKSHFLPISRLGMK